METIINFIITFKTIFFLVTLMLFFVKFISLFGSRNNVNDNTKKTNKTYSMSKTYSVYVITNRLNNKLYIGYTKKYEKRKQEHFDRDYRAKEFNKLLYKAMEELGEENFKITKLFDKLHYNEARYSEAKLIKEWNTINPRGYNVSSEQKSMRFGYNVAKYNQKFYKELIELCKKTPPMS
jgi:predicted GIY-YIG superfamily endonuclease